MSFDTFSRGDSILHRLDPRVKVLGAAGLIMVVALANRPQTVLAGMGVGALFLALARLPVRMVLRRLAMVNTFVLMLWLTLPLTYPGEMVAAGPLSLSLPGLLLALMVTLKANTVFLYLITLPATSGATELGRALQDLGLPVKLCLLLLFSQRYILVVEQEYQRLHRAARLRCFRPSSTLHGYRTYAHLFAMTLVRSWNRAQRVGMAMALRGFRGRFHPLAGEKIRLRDRWSLVLLLAAAALLAGWDFLPLPLR